MYTIADEMDILEAKDRPAIVLLPTIPTSKEETEILTAGFKAASHPVLVIAGEMYDVVRTQLVQEQLEAVGLLLKAIVEKKKLPPKESSPEEVHQQFMEDLQDELRQGGSIN